MLILARFMLLKALDNSQTDRGYVARGLWALIAPLLTAVRPFRSLDSWLYCSLKGQATST